jgi:hypothetical protein
MNHWPETTHWDVAAYALGVLDPAEQESYERHLAECPSCAAELEFLLPASTLLADVDPEGLREAADPRLVDRLLDAVRLDRHRARTRRRLTLAVAAGMAAVAIGLALFAGATWLGDAPSAPLAEGPASPTPEVPAGIGGPEPGAGEQVSATDPATGVHVDVLLESRDWGTQLSFALSSLTGPRECQLVVVRTDGATEVVASWQVPVDGYGTSEQPSPLLLQAATAVPRSDIDHLRVQVREPDGTTSDLVTVSL